MNLDPKPGEPTRRDVVAGLTGLTTVSLLPTSTGAQTVATTPTLIVRNAKITTFDRARPEAQAIAVVGNRILAIGSEADWVR
jgi:hypothetical protein